jgi:DNA ligase 1
VKPITFKAFTSTFPIILVPQCIAKDEKQLLDLEKLWLGRGFEGVMIRDPNGRYKQGRSTAKEQILLKLKRFVDEEATVLDFVEKQHNDNELEKDALGHAKRSHRKSGMRPAGTLGAFVCESENFTDTFEIGTGRGLTDALRKSIWNNRSKYKGRLVKFRYQAIGTKDRPRGPVFLGFRDKRDL